MAKTNKKDLPDHYVVTVEGTFYDKVGGDKTIKPYVATFPIPVKVVANVPERVYNSDTKQFEYVEKQSEQHIDTYGIMRFLKNTHKLQDKVELLATNFVGIRTHSIINITTSAPHIELPDNPYVLNLPQLRKFIKVKGWPIDVKLFNNLAALREATINYKEDPDSYRMYEQKFKQRNAVRSSFSENMEILENYYEEQGSNVGEPGEPTSEEPNI